MIPGEYILAKDSIVANANRPTAEVRVVNTGDRAIQVGSHFHFFEVNRALEFDRAKAFGMRLNIPSGAAIRFEPGDDRIVTLVRFGGKAIARGFNGLVNGPTSAAKKAAAMRRGAKWGFAGKSGDA
ncbi:MAG: urease subunit beta [Candidatus Binataceae bacterium]